MMKLFKYTLFAVVVFLVLASFGDKKADKVSQDRQVDTGIEVDTSWITNESTRTTHLGFTRWPPSFDVDAIEYMYDFIGVHGDLIAHHFPGGVPWVEAFADREYSAHLQNDWEFARSRTKPGHKVYVAISPLAEDRKSLASYWGESDNLALPAPWNEYTLNHPAVQTAFLNYARDVVEFFNPDYLAIGIEVNIAIKEPEVWQAYKELYAHVYTELKNEYPDLPVFATISQAHLEGLEDNADPAEQEREVRDFLANNDLVGVSTYPYGFAGRIIRPVPETHFDTIVDIAAGKPIAITETGMPSQDFKSMLFSYEFTEADQLAYINLLLQQASEHNFVFVVNWAAIDFDKLIDDIPSLIMRSMSMLWVYTGFERSDGTVKPALTVWDAYLALPKVEE